ncbi:unnamed protein product [Prunus armeniaca]
MEYDGKLDEETEAFSAELEIMLQGDLGINMVFILSKKFRAAEGQESTLEGDVPSEESFECRLAEVKEVPEWPIPTAKAGRTAMKLAAKQLYTTSTTYNALLGRDWIHQSLCVSSTLHQQYYHDDLGPFTFFGVNQNGRPHGVTA